MKRPLSALLLLLSHVCLGGVGSALAQEGAGRGLLRGTVVEAESGTPLAGARVRLLELDLETGTDSGGRFAFEKVPAGSYTLRVTAAGRVPREQVVGLGWAEERRLDVALEAQAIEAPGVVVMVDRFRVVGDPSRIEEIPGSAHYLDQEDLDFQNLLVDDVHRLLRQVPGVNIQEEEGFGLRANIGLRGSGSERSSKVTLMEDGVLIAPAPYAAPAAYYFPVVGRMEAVEVRKGSSQIKYGPLTTGGAVNLISSAIPDDFAGRVDLAGGAHGTGKLQARAADSYRNFGWLLETYQIGSDGFKHLDGGGDTGFHIQDYLLKLRLNTDREARTYQEFELKLGRTDEVSDETYLGLTEADFRQDPFRRYAASQEDVLRAEHEQYQARHFIRPSSRLDVTTVLYRNDFHRNWYKLQDVNGQGLEGILHYPETFAAELDVIRGATSEPGALRVRANNRTYYAQGVQSVLGLQLGTGGAAHELELGIRYHEDREDRFQHDDRFQMVEGHMVLTAPGAPGSQANRLSDAQAWAFFVQDQISFGNWIVTPGLRYEDIEFTRTDYDLDDPDRRDSTTVRENGVNVLIPGAGVSYAPTADLSLFGGLHRGFAPPGPGADQGSEAEESVNYELGTRFRRGTLNTQLVGFYNDYENILGRATLAVGESGTGELFNGGAVEVRGVELSLDYDFGVARGLGMAIPLRLAYTYTDAEFRSSFESTFEPWGTVEAGDDLPYVSDQQLFASVGVERPGWGLSVTANFVSGMRTAAGRGPIPPGEATDASLVFGISGEYALTPWSLLFAGVQNLTDQEYVAARRPAGARPGLPRTFAAGIRLTR
jgi:Fe(3+) dicitrate transport protein